MISTFYTDVPAQITINRNWSCRPSEPQNAWKKPYLQEPATVESVQAALERGPFAAMAAVGPQRYTAQPVLIGQIPNHPDVSVYGWKASAEKTTTQFSQTIIICGVQKAGEQEVIHYVLADDVSEDPKIAIGKVQPSSDKRVFVTSLKTYNECESDMFPPVSEEEEKNYSSQWVVPSPLAGKPQLIEAWKNGSLLCERLPNGGWKVSQKPSVTVSYF